MRINDNHVKKKTLYSVIAARLLLIIGIGIPAVSIAVVLISLNGDMVFFTGPVILLALWIFPIIGGSYAEMRKHFKFVLSSSMISFVYWIPVVYIYMGITSFQWVLSDFRYSGCLCLYVPIVILTIPAFIFVVLSKKEFQLSKENSQ